MGEDTEKKANGPRAGPLSAAETLLEDLRDANQHLVLATLAARQLEEAANRTKRQQDEFLAMLAHELRNPLAPIRSAVALLERLQTTDPRIAQISAVVRRQVGLMARLLDDLLDVSRVTSGKVTLRRRPTSVREFIDQAVEINRALIDAQHQQFTLDLPDTPIYVDGDPTRLAQIFGNLLHNATKYTPDGGAIELSIRVEGSSVILRLKDAGNGISKDAVDHIFDLFTQENRTLSRSQGGLGIGLTVVRSMVLLHGGSVAVRSDGLGKGSEFTVVLPRTDYVAEPALEPASEAQIVPARILVVDDNVDVTAMMSMLLDMTGYEVEVAHDGANALATFARQKSQIVLCDIGLPGMNGYEIAARIRQENRTDQPAPMLIALTGYDSPADRAKALAAGFDHHVAKPVDFDDLLELIKQPTAPASRKPA